MGSWSWPLQEAAWWPAAEKGSVLIAAEMAEEEKVGRGWGQFARQSSCFGMGVNWRAITCITFIRRRRLAPLLELIQKLPTLNSEEQFQKKTWQRGAQDEEKLPLVIADVTTAFRLTSSYCHMKNESDFHFQIHLELSTGKYQKSTRIGCKFDCKLIRDWTITDHKLVITLIANWPKFDSNWIQLWLQTDQKLAKN